ncbi:hypothetical protein PRIPAC_71360 [Pristionchus pacificus]|uniref:G protein-coupled receptor n=1 Tax=Pristionchus pacificus TaxID=54126 RepID=A0A8R1U5B6_PRIPA|nr:hypothetical protein PRIPAC_71360 [Pristionchus pacificus]|eukprot:PDM68563.1 hypothetical protein PRIPAC_44065 [Pristionchus pacificus]
MRFEMFTIFDNLFIVEILIVFMSSFTLTIFPIIIFRTRAISAHFRFLLILLWTSHFLLVLAHVISIIMRLAWQDIPMCCLPWDAFQTFRLIHDVGFYFSTTAMILLIYDRFLFTIFYRAEKRQKHFRQVTIILVPLGLFIACFWAYRADVDAAIAEACLIAHSCDAVSCVFCAITYFRSRRKYRESFTIVTLNTRYLLFESQELTYALLPVCVMAVILKNVSLTTIWIFALNPNFPHAYVMLCYFSVNTINVFLSQTLLVRWHRLLWKRFKEIIGCKPEEREVIPEKQQYAAYFEMIDKHAMLSIFDYLFVFEILIVLMASSTLTLFPLIILRTQAISAHYRFLLLLLWVSHLLLVLAQLTSIVLRIIWHDIQMNLFIIPFEAYQAFRLTHEVGFFFSTTAMILLVYDRFLFTLYYQLEMRQKFFRVVMLVLVPLGLCIACYAAYRATVVVASGSLFILSDEVRFLLIPSSLCQRLNKIGIPIQAGLVANPGSYLSLKDEISSLEDSSTKKTPAHARLRIRPTVGLNLHEAVAEACLIAHFFDAISCVFCVITYFRSRRKYRESFTHVTLNTRFLLFESQELTFALLPVCLMAVILKSVSLTSIWMFTINRASIPLPCVLLVFYSVNTINVFLSQALLVRWHRLLWKRFKYAAYFEMMDKQGDESASILPTLSIFLIFFTFLHCPPLVLIAAIACNVHALIKNQPTSVEKIEMVGRQCQICDALVMKCISASAMKSELNHGNTLEASEREQHML